MNDICASVLLTEQFSRAAGRIEAGKWEDLRDARILITGGTGFVGKWLLGTLLAADRQLGLALRVVILTRAPNLFRKNYPELCPEKQVELVVGDICEASKALSGTSFSHIIHAATEASAKLNAEDPLKMIDTIVFGTREILRLAAVNPPRRFLFVSSGAIYGPQPESCVGLPECWGGGPDPMSSGAAYHEAKRLAEQMCAAAARTGVIRHLGVARLFAFVGPFLPLDTHFAVGNFIRDVLARKTIQLRGDGTTVRSYLDAGDMAAWILTVLLRGKPTRAYNVGSAAPITMRSLADLVASLDPGVAVEVLGRSTPGQVVDRYVPEISRAIDELGVAEWTGLEISIRSTFEYHKMKLSLADN